MKRPTSQQIMFSVNNVETTVNINSWFRPVLVFGISGVGNIYTALA